MNLKSDVVWSPQLFSMTWIKSWTTTSCAAESGTAGTSPSLEKSSPTTRRTANLSAKSVTFKIRKSAPAHFCLNGSPRSCSAKMFVRLQAIVQTWRPLTCQTCSPRKSRLRWNWPRRSPWERKCRSRTSATSSTCVTRCVFCHDIVWRSRRQLLGEITWPWWWWRHLSFLLKWYMWVFQSLPHLNSHVTRLQEEPGMIWSLVWWVNLL